MRTGSVDIVDALPAFHEFVAALRRGDDCSMAPILRKRVEKTKRSLFQQTFH
jgi:hypothetical protein